MSEISIGRDLLRATDIVEFATELGLPPDEKQRQLLTSTAKDLYVLCCRQFGKSSLVACKSLHHALYPTAIYLQWS